MVHGRISSPDDLYDNKEDRVIFAEMKTWQKPDMIQKARAARIKRCEL